MTSKDKRQEWRGANRKWQAARVYGSQARKDRVERIADQVDKAKESDSSFADAMDEMGAGFPEADPRLDHRGTP